MVKGNILTGSKDAHFIKEQYQSILDTYDKEIIHNVHKLEEYFEKIGEAFNKAQSLKKDIEAHEVERQRAYEALGNLLSGEKDFEKEMWKETSAMHEEISKNQQAKAIKVKQSLRQSDDNEIRFAAMMKYIEKYPQYQTKSSINDIREKIKNKEREIRHSKREYNEAVGKYNALFPKFLVLFNVCENKIKEYKEKLSEAHDKLKNSRFQKSIFYKLASEEKKSQVNINTIKHRVSQFEPRFKAIQEQLPQYKSRKFVELDF